MKENTSRFWLVVTVVLATLYLISNPAVISKVGSGLSGLWQAITQRVKTPVLSANLEQTEQPSLAEPNRLVAPIFDQAQQRPSDPKEEATPDQDGEVVGHGKEKVEVTQTTQSHGWVVPEVKMEDVLISQKEKPPTGVTGKVSINEQYIPLETLKEIYARHMEALKILNSKPESEKNEK